MTSVPKNRVALVGTGSIGFAVATRLLARGEALVVYNRTRATAAPLEARGARLAQSVEEACAEAETLVFSLPGARVITEMLDAVGAAGLRGKTVVQLGLVSRANARRLERKVRGAGGEYLNVAPCGSRGEAERGGLVLLAGGKRGTFRRQRALLAHLGRAIHVGGTRASATVGLAMMVLSFTYVASFCHAVGTVRRGGGSIAALLETLGSSKVFTDAASFLKEHLGRSGEPVSPAQRNAIRGMLREGKDVAHVGGLNDVVFRAVRGETRRAHLDEVARFVGLGWPRALPFPPGVGDHGGDAEPLRRAIFQLLASAFAAYRLVGQMLDAQRIPQSVLTDILERSPIFNDVHRGLVLAAIGRIELRNYGGPYSTVRVIHEELRQLRSTLASLGIESALRPAMARLTRGCMEDGLGEADFFAVYLAIDPPDHSEEKRRALGDNARHVNPGRVGFFLSAGMDFVMGKREGCYLQDLDGKVSLFDAHCNGGVFNLGHRNPEIAGALRGALETLDIGNHHLLSAQRGALARRLAELLPGDVSRVVFGVSGGESVDLAIKIARASTKREKILFARGGYHGHTGLAVFAGDARFFEDFATRPPSYEEVELGSLASLRAKLDERTAAVIYETVPASVGMPVPARDFYMCVREACDEVGALLIVDEVQTGWGRTGKLWGIEHYDVVPDVIVLGKGMSAGHYPMSAVCFRGHLGEYLTRDSFRHQSTMGGAELGCAVVQKQLDVLTEPGFLRRVQEQAALFGELFAGLKARNEDVVVEVRQLGLMMGLVYAHAEMGPLMTRCAYDEGVLLVFAGLEPRVSQVLPPLTVTEGEARELVGRIERAVGRARGIVRMRARL